MENLVVSTVVHRPVEEVFEAITRMKDCAPCLRWRTCEFTRGTEEDALRVKLDLTGRVRIFEAKVVRYKRHEYIEWRSTRGLYISGEIITEGLPGGTTHLIVVLHYNAEGFAERVLALTHVVYHRLDAAAECLKGYLESLEMSMPLPEPEPAAVAAVVAA